MSNLRRSQLAQANSNAAPVGGAAHAASPLAAFKRRWWVYALGAVVGVLTLAWIDGDEEPIRPIAQAVDMDGQGAKPE